MRGNRDAKFMVAILVPRILKQSCQESNDKPRTKKSTMKVVLFCGGMGTRMREYSESIPKPMVPIGYRPIIWHVMKYYAHYGHKDFILCLGYKADVIKNYFRNYDECVSNDFILSGGGKNLELLSSDIQDWRITFVDTGLMSNIGMRLRAVKKYVQDEEIFLANYTDGLSDVSLHELEQIFLRSNKVACFVSVKPRASFHMISVDRNGVVKGIEHITKSGVRINGGFFLFRREVFTYIKDGEELVEGPFRRLITAGQLISHAHNGFWACMDTFRERQELEDLYSRGNPPWAVWNGHFAEKSITLSTT
jgi:glucose-1-phosphate cytidylyltransferase